MSKSKITKQEITQEQADKIMERAKQDPDSHIIVNRYTMSHSEHREALSEEMSEKFKMRKRQARDFIEHVAEDAGLK